MDDTDDFIEDYRKRHAEVVSALSLKGKATKQEKMQVAHFLKAF